MNMGIDFGTAIFEQTTDVAECPQNAGTVMSGHGVRSIQKSLADSAGVGMKDKNGEDVAKDHARQDEGNPPDYE